MLANRDVQLVTPEAVVLELATAGIGSRLLAAVIDATIQGALGFAVVAGVVVVAASGARSPAFAIAAFTAGAFLILLGYPAFFETVWRGRTPGKAAMGLRVVTTEGSPIRFRHAAVRSALGLVDFVMTSGAGAILSILVTRNDQRLGDLAAGTLVVRERTGATAPMAVSFPVPRGYEDYVGSLDVSPMTPEHYVAIRTFLLRAASLPPQVRAHLAAQFVAPLASRLRQTPPASMHPETFLACAAAAYQHQSAATSAGAPAIPPPPAPPLPPPPAPSSGEAGFAPPS